MIDITKTTGIQTRLQEFSNKSKETATMRINIPKMVRMTIAPKITVTKTTEEDIIADQATFMYECIHCTRRFPSQISLSCHYPRWCPKVITAAADARPRRNQLANKIIEAKNALLKLRLKLRLS